MAVKRALDFTYCIEYPYIRLMPKNQAAEKIWCQIEEHFMGCVIPVSAWPGVRYQIRAAGYTVRKHRPRRLSATELADLYAEFADLDAPAAAAGER